MKLNIILVFLSPMIALVLALPRAAQVSEVDILRSSPIIPVKPTYASYMWSSIVLDAESDLKARHTKAELKSIASASPFRVPEPAGT